MKVNNEVCLNEVISYTASEGLNIDGTNGIKEIFGFGGAVQSFKDDPEILLNLK